MEEQKPSSLGASSATDFIERCNREIVELHQFFEDWLSGKAPKNEQTFSRFTDATAPSMMLVSTEGMLLDYDQLVEWIYEAHDSEPGFHLWVTAVQTRQVLDSIALLTYEERQERRSGPNVRQSTALFEKWEPAPNGVRWLHVHETAMLQR